MVTITRLEEVLKSKHGILTPEEFGILQSSKLKAVSDFFSGAITAGIICWTGASMLCKSFPIKLQHDPAVIRSFKMAFQMFVAAGKINISIAPATRKDLMIVNMGPHHPSMHGVLGLIVTLDESALVYGRLKFNRAVSSSADYILEQKGSRIRKELANIWLTKSQIQPHEMLVFHKHFFVEEIYDDSTSDHPKLMPRYRNFFSDNVVHGQITDDCDTSDVSYRYSHDDSKSIAHGDSKEASDSTRTKVNTRPIFMEDADPLDDLFGYGAPMEDIHPLITSNKPPGGVPNRCHKRSHRRRWMRRHEDPSNHKI